MPEEMIIDRIKNKEWKVILDIKSAGKEIEQSLIPLTTHKDPEVRELTLYCLNEIDELESNDVFTKALKDDEEAIRNRACLFLHEHNSENIVPDLFHEIDDNPDIYVREQMPLIIGRVEDPNSIPELKKYYKKEPDDIVRGNIGLAMARLKEEKCQKKVLEALKMEDVQLLYQALKDFEYMNDRTLLEQLLPLLDDFRDAKKIGPSGHDYFLRICDATINIIDSILDHPFEFNGAELRQFNEQELSSGKSVIKQNK